MAFGSGLGQCSEEVKSEAEEHHGSDEFEPVDVSGVLYDIDGKGHACARKEGIDDVAEGSSGSCGKSIDAALAQRTPYAEYAHGAHRSRGYDAYEQTLDNELSVAAKFQPDIVYYFVHDICELGMMNKAFRFFNLSALYF